VSIMQKLQNNAFYLINSLTGRVASLEAQIFQLRREMDKNFAIQRQHMIRLKNQQEIPDDFLRRGRPYLDLTPEQAWRQYQDPEFDFIFLDVSHREFTPEVARAKTTRHIPLEELADRWHELPQSSTPILVISEDGLRSILACDFFVAKGYYNCSNVSGGWRYWPGARLKLAQTEEQSA